MNRAQLIAEREQHVTRIQHLEAENNWLKEQFKLSRHRQFGSSSEKIFPQTEMVFDEAETTLDSATVVAEPETVTYTRKPKSTGHRQEMLEDLPTETIEYKLPEDQQTCAQCGGHLHEMSTQTREEIEIIPARVKVIKHVQSIYSCRNCEANEISVPIVTAPAPRAMIAKSLASPSAVAYIMASKFVESLPLYRQEQHFETSERHALSLTAPRNQASSHDAVELDRQGRRTARTDL